MTKGTLALRYAEQETIQPIVLIWTAKWARISVAYSLVVQGRLKSIISISEVGNDRPTAFEPKSIAWVDGNRDCMKNLTL